LPEYEVAIGESDLESGSEQIDPKESSDQDFSNDSERDLEKSEASQEIDEDYGDES
jgi:hypothetical protein